MDYIIVTAFASLGVVIWAGLTYFFQQRQLKLNGLLEAFKLLNDREHREARGMIYSIFDTYKQKGDVSIFTGSSANQA